jgi:menaquinol-cytochrome c reductase iron-sulfur subunit
MNGKNLISRRDFMKFATWAIGGLISAGMSIPAIAYIIGPAVQSRNAQNLMRLGSTTKIELGTPTLFKVKLKHQTGWIIEEKELSVHVLTENGRDFIAMSNICTHLACRVRWVADQEQFFCPCHNAVFAKDGSVISGPPPRPLDRYEVKVEQDQIFIVAG